MGLAICRIRLYVNPINIRQKQQLEVTMKAISFPLLFAILVSIGTTSAAKDEVRRIGLTDFNEIHISSGIEAKITVGSNYSIIATGEPHALDMVDFHLNGSALVAKKKGGLDAPLFPWFRKKFKVVLDISLPTINAIEANSGSSVVISGTLKRALLASASSGASLAIKGVDGAAVQITASSGASAVAHGTCSNLRAIANGGASLNAGKLACASALAKVSSGGSLIVNGTQSLSLSASSGGSLIARGGGKITEVIKTSGGSLIISP